ncbi:hypothetical protein LB823_15485 [Tsukamurella sp. M9C]|uniref:hypothetical protein n=1 Tax=Tsukamurella sp. M9C TaxID=2877520 RepID=UPI001CCF8DD1|nr:hypothetical protein [Tsukamurella sp. M9C]MCA0157595.1 hypothetical protein [Tsukamurella sp. M9C]
MPYRPAAAPRVRVRAAIALVIATLALVAGCSNASPEPLRLSLPPGAEQGLLDTATIDGAHAALADLHARVREEYGKPSTAEGYTLAAGTTWEVAADTVAAGLAGWARDPRFDTAPGYRSRLWHSDGRAVTVGLVERPGARPALLLLSTEELDPIVQGAQSGQ